MKKRVDNRVCIVYSSYCSDAEQLTYATVAQLVEYDLAKVGVAGSNPVCRSLIKSNAKALLFCFIWNIAADHSYCKRARKPRPEPAFYNNFLKIVLVFLKYLCYNTQNALE